MSRSRKGFVQANGFTLIELMVAIVIAAILLTIAVPSFDAMIKKNNVEALQSKLASALATARTEAASRNKIITICSLNAAGTDCADSQDWSKGWVVFEDGGDQNKVEATDIVIDIFENTGSYGMKSSDKSFSFKSQGFLVGGGTGYTVICDAAKNLTYARGLYVNASGLIVKMTDTDSNGVVNIPGGTNVGTGNCP